MDPDYDGSSALWDSKWSPVPNPTCAEQRRRLDRLLRRFIVHLAAADHSSVVSVQARPSARHPASLACLGPLSFSSSPCRY